MLRFAGKTENVIRDGSSEGGKLSFGRANPVGHNLPDIPDMANVALKVTLVHRLAYNGDVVAFKMGRRQGARRAHI